MTDDRISSVYSNEAYDRAESALWTPVEAMEKATDEIRKVFDLWLQNQDFDFRIQVFEAAVDILCKDYHRDSIYYWLEKEVKRAETDEQKQTITLSALRYIPEDRANPSNVFWLLSLAADPGTRWAVTWAYWDFDDKYERLEKHWKLYETVLTTFGNKLPSVTLAELTAALSELCQEEDTEGDSPA